MDSRPVMQGPVHGKQTNYIDEWMTGYVAEQGVVLAVWRGRPDAEDTPPELIPDPKAEQIQAMPPQNQYARPSSQRQHAVKAIEDLVKFRRTSPVLPSL